MVDLKPETRCYARGWSWASRSLQPSLEAAAGCKLQVAAVNESDLVWEKIVKTIYIKSGSHHMWFPSSTSLHLDSSQSCLEILFDSRNQELKLTLWINLEQPHFSVLFTETLLVQEVQNVVSLEFHIHQN
jgi:hypothetical protein